MERMAFCCMVIKYVLTPAILPALNAAHDGSRFTSDNALTKNTLTRHRWKFANNICATSVKIQSRHRC